MPLIAELDSVELPRGFGRDWNPQHARCVRHATWRPLRRYGADRDVFTAKSDRYTTAINSSQSLSLVVDEGARTVTLTAVQPL